MKPRQLMAAAFILAGLPFAASATVIDDFSCVTQQVTVTTAGGSGSDLAAAACAIGGYRAITAENTNGSGTVVTTTATDPTTAPQYLEFTNGTGDLGIGVVAWFGSDITTGFGPLALDGSSFLLSYQSDNGGNVGDALQLELVVFSAGGAFDSVTWTVGNTGGTFIDHLVPFGAFTGVDFSNVIGLGLVMTSLQDDVDFALDFVSTVPEPGTLALLGLGLLGLGAVSRRRA